MLFVYFTKALREETIEETAAFIQSAGAEGADLAVRPGYPVHPGNVESALGSAVKTFGDRGLKVPLISAPTSMNDPTSIEARRLFAGCASAGVPAIKLGYFVYAGDYRRDADRAKKGLEGFAKLADKHKVRALYHTHSGNFLGCNGESMRALLEGLDPHLVGAYVDTGHQSVRGAPFRFALDAVAPWFSMLAIKDMVWRKENDGWRYEVVPVGQGIADWREIRQALRDRNYQGTISLHGEYHATDKNHRQQQLAQEIAFLKKALSN